MIPRALAIFAVACLAGAVHLMVRDQPILLARSVQTETTPIDSTTPDVEDPAPLVPVENRTESTSPPNPEPLVDNPLFDAEVKPNSITLREAYLLYMDGATFLDARHEHEFDEAHVSGAIWMPSSRLSSGEGIEDAQYIDASLPVVIYCTGGDCDASENTAILLESLNFGLDIRILGMGYEDWAACGLPVEGFGVEMPAEGSP